MQIQRLKSLLHFTFWRRAQYNMGGCQDGFHFFVPPFKSKIMRVYHREMRESRNLFPTSGYKITHRASRLLVSLQTSSIPGTSGRLRLFPEFRFKDKSKTGGEAADQTERHTPIRHVDHPFLTSEEIPEYAQKYSTQNYAKYQIAEELDKEDFPIHGRNSFLVRRSSI